MVLYIQTPALNCSLMLPQDEEGAGAGVSACMVPLVDLR